MSVVGMIPSTWMKQVLQDSWTTDRGIGASTQAIERP
jgi:hypothetical protein